MTILLYPSSTVVAQDNYLAGGIGVGTYYMKRLKSFESESIKNSIVQLENLENFNPYWCYSLKGGKRLGKNEIGSNLSFCSTGSRSGYEDYSGYVYFDQIVYGLSIGPYMNFLLQENQNQSLFLGVGINFILSHYKIRESGRVLTNDYEQTINARSMGGEVELNLSYRFEIDKFFIQPQAGVLINVINSTLKTTEGKGKMYYNNGNDSKPLKVDWSGVRAYLCVGYFL